MRPVYNINKKIIISYSVSFFFSDKMSSSVKHLVVIIDLNPFYWSDKISSSTPLNFKQYLNIIIQFCNAYIAFDINHRLTIIGCSNNETCFLYPDPNMNH